MGINPFLIVGTDVRHRSRGENREHTQRDNDDNDQNAATHQRIRLGEDERKSGLPDLRLLHSICKDLLHHLLLALRCIRFSVRLVNAHEVRKLLEIRLLLLVRPHVHALFLANHFDKGVVVTAIVAKLRAFASRPFREVEGVGLKPPRDVSPL